jgi:hypothetical protein
LLSFFGDLEQANFFLCYFFRSLLLEKAKKEKKYKKKSTKEKHKRKKTRKKTRKKMSAHIGKQSTF